MILTGARVVTMDPAMPLAQAVAIREGRILTVGSDHDILAALPGAERIDAGGRLVLPGFIDAHVHLLDGGTDLAFSAQLHEVQTVEEMLSMLAATAARVTGPLVVGAGWQATAFGDGTDGLMTRQLLDRAVPDRPCIAYDSSFHLGLMNSAACAATGLDTQAEDPPNGHFVRDAAGRPTGMLHEEAVTWALRNGLPGIPPDWHLQGLRAGQAHANAHGLTGVLDPSIDPWHLAGWRAVDAAGGLTLRATGALKVRAEDDPDQVLARLIALRGEGGDDFRITSAKIFLDGVLENRTAALIAPYADAPGGNAPVMFEQPALDHLCRLVDAAGFQLHFHCIGDAATRAALDALQAARNANGPPALPPQIAHCQIVAPADHARFAALEAMANIQPLWARRDPGDESWHVMVGPERDLYPFRSLIDAGAPFCLSSDFPVSSLNPFEIIETAVTRRARGGVPLDAGQALTVDQAVAGYTLHAATAMGTGHLCGRLAPGLSADLILLDRDIFAIPPDRIADTQVLLTLFKGAEVWRAPGFGG